MNCTEVNFVKKIFFCFLIIDVVKVVSVLSEYPNHLFLLFFSS